MKTKISAAAFIVFAFFAVMGHDFSDTAKTPFWWTFWDVAAWASIPLCIGIFVYWWNTQAKDKNNQKG